MIFSALQFCPAFLDVAANQRTLADWLGNCEADVAVLPELCTTGYFFHDTEQLYGVAEAADGPTVQFFREHAAERGMLIVAGFAERDGDAVYNSAVTVFPNGRTEIYRKVHLFAEEKLHFTPGNLGFRVHTWGDRLRLGVMICYDWRFPEAARALTLGGAQVIAHPSNLVAAPRLWQPVMRTRGQPQGGGRARGRAAGVSRLQPDHGSERHGAGGSRRRVRGLGERRTRSDARGRQGLLLLEQHHHRPAARDVRVRDDLIHAKPAASHTH